MEYIKAVPNSTILIVNTAPITAYHYKRIAEESINPDDNVSIYTAEEYEEAIQIIDKTKTDILTTSFFLYYKDKTGLDLCKYMKQRNPNSVCTIISLMFSVFQAINDRNFMKRNKDYVDFAYDATENGNCYRMFPTAFESLRVKLAAKAKFQTTP